MNEFPSQDKKQHAGDATRDAETVPASEIRHHPDVREALARSTPAPLPEAARRRVPRLAVHLLLSGVFGLLLYLLERTPSLASRGWPSRLALAGLIFTLILALYETASAVIVPRFRNRVVRFNVVRILKLLAASLLLVSIISIFFAGWYATAVSLGLLSLVLGFALQAPITSFFAWIYILLRSPYRVGDRIRIGEATGDVIDVGYLDTTLWEFGGEFLSTDHPSGRVIKFPNSLVFNSTVYNYSWSLFPYVWNEIAVQVAYESDLEFVASTMRAAVEEERGTAMPERIRAYRELLANTPVDHLEVEEQPTVLFRPSSNTWIEAIVRYLVTPRRAGRVKTLLIRKILERLNASPEKVLFPKANLR